MKCAYCTADATTCQTVMVGERPADPRKWGTQADHRKIVVVRTCAEHGPSRLKAVA